MDTDLGTALVALARNAIARALGLTAAPAPAPGHPRLAAPGASFVTLRQGADLRGCIGSLEAFRALRDDVEANARAAAFRDPRFPPLARDEFARTAAEVSLLSASEPLPAASEREALALLRPDVDGVVLECGRHRATFLPQVWEQMPDPQAFLEALKRKAGLPADYWSDDVRLARYTVEKFAERAPARVAS
ncbi:MAG: AmmeMemoRadiSam system protein A [Burkholderiales bacterium]